MIKRELEAKLLSISKQYPVTTITGPRQSGKTTLCKMAFPNMDYVSLEDLQNRDFAIKDPKGFLAQFKTSVVIDEVQRVPDLLSYIQVIVDEKRKNGLYILTGSQNFQMSSQITQSLAGRTAILKLLPFSISEIKARAGKMSLDELLLCGFYPRIHQKKLNPTEALGFYCESYIEKDVRSLTNLKNLSAFRKFLKLCAGRVGQLLDITNLGNEAGVSHTTAREWLSLLEAGYIVFLLQPYHRNFNKRIIKSPKLYFHDIGLAAYLLGIENEKQMQRDPLRGNLFENLVVCDFLKDRFNDAKTGNFYFFRDSNGKEVDLIADYGENFYAVEIKSGQTITDDYFKGLNYIENIAGSKLKKKFVVYGGRSSQKRKDATVMSYLKCEDIYNDWS